MVFASAILANLLLATAAFAAPSRSEERIARRRAGRQSNPNFRLGGESQGALSTNASHVEFSSNWAGAVWDTQPAGTFKSVTGTFVVPTPTGSNGAASAWVGIDGDTCGSAILQTGVDFTISNGRVSYDAWFEWFPAAAVDFSGITIRAGDTITVTVTASTTKSGTAVIQNKSNGQTVSKSLSSSSALCEQNAEWIVEDFEEGGSLVTFANFGTVTFTNAVATTFSGSTFTPAGATLIEIEQGSTVLTTVSTSGNNLIVKHN
ncbi:hypothetical protein D9613_012749 [Agrocybe pediades]|uniref:Aspergillopepsin n=1 Tax=Agrocybe pediades TaxID=84607 RepID=A0A8H4QKD6_9AGAR|nr:hypothetical protein D9613_012749 [Agrocybe pediades]